MKFKITMFEREPSFSDIVSVIACMMVLGMLVVFFLVNTPWVFLVGVVGVLVWGVYHFIKTGVEIE